MEAATMEMPRYKCHKEVHALKIAGIELGKFPPFLGAVCRGAVSLGTACGSCERCRYYSVNPEGPGYIITPEDSQYAPFPVETAYVAKHSPSIGGYFIVYKGGYKSFSPADAFEEGYSRV